MYWSDWGNHPKIETAAMDGTLRETLVQDNIQWPTGPWGRGRVWEGQVLVTAASEATHTQLRAMEEAISNRLGRRAVGVFSRWV